MKIAGGEQGKEWPKKSTDNPKFGITGGGPYSCSYAEGMKNMGKEQVVEGMKGTAVGGKK